MMTEETALFVKPLLEMVFDKVSCSEMLPEDYFDLDEFRQLPLNLFAGDIRSWYYNLCREHLKYDFEKPLFVPEKKCNFANKTILVCTERYQNASADYSVLSPFRDKLVFLGLNKEYEKFCSR